MQVIRSIYINILKMENPVERAVNEATSDSL